jgi:hypothetical protein
MLLDISAYKLPSIREYLKLAHRRLHANCNTWDATARRPQKVNFCNVRVRLLSFYLDKLSCSSLRVAGSNETDRLTEKLKTYVKNVVLLEPGKWGIVMDFVLEEKELIGKELLVDYDETVDLNESREGCLMIETLEAPMVKRGDTIEITVRDRKRKKRTSSSNGKGFEGPKNIAS